jgi:hypothetical protein
MVGDFPALAGVSRARHLFSRLVTHTADTTPKGVLILDFSGVADASASFLRESVLAFRDYVRAYQPELYPVLANLSAAVREELHALMRDRREAVMICTLHDGIVSAPEVLGALESGAALALDIVRRRTQVTLGDLRNETPKILGPVWNNRLASLIRQGFVIPSADSRGRMYRFVLADAGGTSGS